jgi:hypothetical protein
MLSSLSSPPAGRPVWCIFEDDALRFQLIADLIGQRPVFGFFGFLTHLYLQINFLIAET